MIKMSKETLWLRTALNNLEFNVAEGTSKKFPCSTKEEKDISLKCIVEMKKLLVDCDQHA